MKHYNANHRWKEQIRQAITKLNLGVIDFIEPYGKNFQVRFRIIIYKTFFDQLILNYASKVLGEKTDAPVIVHGDLYLKAYYKN